MIRLRYPNIAPCEMMFYRISSVRHYHTFPQCPCPLVLSLAAPLDADSSGALPWLAHATQLMLIWATPALS